MEKEFIPYDLALTLKELGFDGPCFAGYDIDTTELYIGYEDNQRTFNIDYHILAPIFSQAFRWFREKNDICSWIYQVKNSKYFFSQLKNGRYLVSHSSEYQTYEEAELECLKKLIGIVKNK